MNNSKILTLVGIGTELVGLYLASKVDLSASRLRRSQDSIRPTALSERFDSALTDQAYEQSTQELEAAGLEKIAENEEIRYFRPALLVIAIGTFVQLLGAALGD
jgi:hypothetical protein